MDTQPILSLIREEALQAAESARAQALERAKVIREESLRSSARMFESAKEDAAHEAEQARDRLRRLRELEDRKYALSARRELIGKAFDEALRKLHVLPQGEMAELMLSLIAANAQGVDIRSKGSKNTGASNVLRVMGLKSGLITFIGATTTLEIVWNFSDTMNGLMAIPNLICLIWLSNDIAEECFSYEKEIRQGEKH